MHAASLVYFRETARAGSVRRAAAALNVSASALNRQVLNLEDELGTRLFDRLPAGMRLTPAGEILLQHVTTTLHDFDRMRTQLEDLKAARSGHVAITAIDSLMVDFLPRALDRFSAGFPAVTYALDTASPAEVHRPVAAGNADLGFTFVGPTPSGLRFEHEVAAPIGVVMPADHPLRIHRAISFEQAAGFPFLAQSGPLPRSAETDAGFARFRASLRPRLVSNSIQALKVAIGMNMGIAFFTRLGFLAEIERGEVIWRPFDSPAINGLRLGLLVPATRPPSAPAARVTTHLVEEMKRLRAI